MAFRNLWVCPRCGRQFANRNQSHSCGGFTVEDNLKGKSPQVIELYRRFEAVVVSLGEVSITPAMTRIGFQARMIFAAVTPKSSRLDGHVVLRRKLENPRFTKVESPAPNCFVHHFSLSSAEEIDEELKSWLKEAYEAGGQSPKS